MRPNILFVMSDDHAAHAIGAYGSAINQTPHLDRLAREGLRLDHCYVTNSLCTPARASILSGQYGHVNGVRTIGDGLDGSRDCLVQKQFRAAGYQTALIGKWHMRHDRPHQPTGFDHWEILPGQGDYYDPLMITARGERQHTGYVTDLITRMTVDWLDRRDRDRPFLMFCHHKAPHRHWERSPKYEDLFEDHDIPEPATFGDDYANRSAAARRAKMTIEHDLEPIDWKRDIPEGLDGAALKSWKYQRYIKDYLACVQSVDDSVGELLDYLEKDGCLDDTLVIYTSDQGFFLGDHGWYDKRFMYEHSLKTPFLARYPKALPAGSTCDAAIANHDFAPTLLDYAGLQPHPDMQGRSARRCWEGTAPADWPTTVYYRYWMHLTHHNVASHYGVRDRRYKLIFYYGEALGTTNSIDRDTAPEWEFFDLENDPFELNNVFDDPQHADAQRALLRELDRLQAHYGDEPRHIPGSFTPLSAT